jgi:glucuronate isomerase
MFWHLLTAPPTANVSLEHLDDVAVHYANGNILLEQTKSALAHNPLSDWSIDLWKTIGNWVDDINAGHITLSQAAFQIYVTPVYQGDFSSAISNAKTADGVQKLVTEISAQVADDPPSDACLAHVKKFLDLDDAKRRAFVERIAVISTDTDPIDALRALLIPTTDEKSIDTLCAVGI